MKLHHRIRKHLQTLQGVRKEKHHHLLHHLHQKYRISKSTLFYVKEYGPGSHVAATIIMESLKILLFSSVMSSLGGLALEHIKFLFISILPLIILMPALNDMIGDYGTIISSRFSTMLYEGKVSGWHRNKELRTLFWQVLSIGGFLAVLSTVLSVAILSFLTDYHTTLMMGLKVLFIAVVDIILLVTILFAIAIGAGLYFYKRQEDPNNFLIPITTSVADFGNMVVLAVLAVLLF